LRAGSGCGMMGHASALDPTRTRPQEGSYEIRFPDGRPSRYLQWDDVPGRRLRLEQVDRAVAERVAKIFARADQLLLNLRITQP
jgi:hypothetical protein